MELIVQPLPYSRLLLVPGKAPRAILPCKLCVARSATPTHP